MCMTGIRLLKKQVEKAAYGKLTGETEHMIDRQGRVIDYMRISITDRCNLRCRYCMPDGITQISMAEILTYEEIRKSVHTLAEELGIQKIKITGGEPLVRKRMRRSDWNDKNISGITQVTMTTNGVLLQEQSGSVKEGRTGRDQYQSGYA